MAKKPKTPKEVETLTHDESSRKNIPTAELESVLPDADKAPQKLRYPRNTDIDPQLVWRGKDEQDWSDLIVQAPPLYIQEKVHPKVLIDDLLRRSKTGAESPDEPADDLFADFNGLPDAEAVTEFYAHDQNWSNRMILGDGLQAMASLAEREGLRGQVQCIYIDPPYGIKFNSNFQWSTTSTIVKDGKKEHITREAEQVRAFRDTWRDGVHSYLTYLRDRLTVARDLLTESGSIFVQIGDENVHRVRALMDEVFGDENFIGLIFFKKTGGLTSNFLASVGDYLLWYGKNIDATKYRQIYKDKVPGEPGATQFKYKQEEDGRIVDVGFDAVKKLPAHQVVYHDNITSQGNSVYPYQYRGQSVERGYKTAPNNLHRVDKADRFVMMGNTPRYVRRLSDFPVYAINELWDDLSISGFADPKIYVVQTSVSVVERVIQLATDPGDLVLDPTCGSGTTAYVAEQWGRRWITIDTSRVALALARARIMGARYPYYLLADSSEGQEKEGEVTGKPPSTAPARRDIRQGFVCERLQHIKLESIANNAEIDVIWEEAQETLEPLRARLNKSLGKSWEEWEIPREAGEIWPKEAKIAHADWWEGRIERQRKIDESISRNAEIKYLYDKPYVDNKRVRVAGPFTVESLSPHRVLIVDENDELLDAVEAADGKRKAYERSSDEADFAEMILEHLRANGVQQANKEDRIKFTSLMPWPGGRFIAAEGKYQEGEDGQEKRAAILIGPEFGIVLRPDLVAAAREAADAGFDILVGCAFNFDAHSSELQNIGKIPILKARMNMELHMGDELKSTGSGNLFVVFGEPDIDIEDAGDEKIQVRIDGVDVFRPQTSEVVSEGTDKIACWFIDTDYNEESFFVRHAYFLGANDPYKALKTSLKAEINEEAWATLHSDVSRPFNKPATGRIAVKVINHLGDEVMKVFRIDKTSP